ncbi:MAG TPA: glycosyltransferase family 2 protein [Polyangiaceae bacterium]|nr:glycosyltransferase family 2 protein [Polyangiaceae bacterium]
MRGDAPDYVLATPMRNERELLPELLGTLRAQSVLPSVWLVVDDHSTDGGREWLEGEASALDWVVVVQAPEDAEEYLGGHIARIKSWGLAQAVQQAQERGRVPSFCGILDADVSLPPDHYERLIAEFFADSSLGVVSSVLKVPGAKNIEAWQRSDLPRGPTQLFTHACWQAIGGLPRVQGYDAIANLKAKNRGFRTKLATNVVASHRRETSTREGHARGFERRGSYAHYLHLHPLLVLGRSLAYSLDAPHAKGLHFLKGWARAALSREPRCPDPEVARHYRHERVREVFNAALGRGIRFVR